MALNFAYYNFCTTRGAIRMTPAQAAGVENSAWTVAEWLNVVENKQDYLDKLKLAIEHLHNCGAHYQRIETVIEYFDGKLVWAGDAEVLGLVGHPKTKRTYAWSHLDGPNDEHTRFVAVLEIPPVDAAKRAVQVQIVKDVREGKSK